MSLKVGDKLYYKTAWSRGEWYDTEITAETDKSWVARRLAKEVRVSKADLTCAPPERNFRSNREQFFTAEQRDAVDAEAVWRSKHQLETEREVDLASFSVLQKVHALLVSEGVLKSEESKNDS